MGDILLITDGDILLNVLLNGGVFFKPLIKRSVKWGKILFTL
jgi:hypothetical protein